MTERVRLSLIFTKIYINYDMKRHKEPCCDKVKAKTNERQGLFYEYERENENFDVPSGNMPVCFSDSMRHG